MKKVILIFLLGLFYVVLYKILIHRLTAFGCMDDCNNFMGGYFLLHGKQLFTQIFFNHAPFMAHLSAFVQFFTHPQNLYELILRHRQFLLLFGLISEIILILRFGISGFMFALVYETTKFYIGGDRFLAEPFIVYPMVYMLGIVYKKFLKEAILRIDYFLVGLCVWFVLFMREPYSLAVLFLFGIFLWGREHGKIKICSLILFFGLSLVTFFSYNPYEFFYNVVYVNKTNLTAENAETGFFGINIYKSFLYPFLIFFQGEWGFFRYIEIGISSLFLFATGIFIWKKQWKFVLVLFVVLGLANIRIVNPGHVYYGAFHLLPWYAMTIFVTCLMFATAFKWNKILAIGGFGGLLTLVIFTFASKGSYIHDRIDEQTEFITNYGNVLQVGNVVASLSTPKDTLFVDGYDDMIYMVAKRYSTYQYSWYTSLMPQYQKYTDARIHMFRTTPPDFYYGNCPGQKQSYYLLPSFVKDHYVQLYNLKSPSCLWVRKDVLARISQTQWQKAGESLYFLKPTKK